MKQKKNGNLIIAAAGSGKTTEIINRIKVKIPELPNDKIMAVITYTNTAANEIKERLEEDINVSENIFIGTIHSFLIRYLIKPFGEILGLVHSELIISDYEIKLKSKDNKNYALENYIINKLCQKGVITYGTIITLSRKILQNDTVRERFCRRIAYLFVDEFQDANNSQFEIFDILRKGGRTQVIFVGDPEQRIMSFLNKGVRKSASNEKLHIIVSLQEKKIYEVEYLEDNFRSSQTIVDFINNFHTCIRQKYANENIKSKNQVYFLKSTNIGDIVDDFNKLCSNPVYCINRPFDRFFLAYENKEFEQFKENDNPKFERRINIIDFIMEYISTVYSIKKTELCQYFECDCLELRNKCLKVAFYIKNNTDLDEDNVTNYIENEFSGLSDKIQGESATKINLKKITKSFLIGVKNIMAMGDDENQNVHSDFNDSYLTIHKSKGMQADAVLVVAKEERELLKWLETDRELRIKDLTDTCRLGYVAFSRAREFLCIACKESINESAVKSLYKLGVKFFERVPDEIAEVSLDSTK